MRSRIIINTSAKCLETQKQHEIEVKHFATLIYGTFLTYEGICLVLLPKTCTLYTKNTKSQKYYVLVITSCINN